MARRFSRVRAGAMYNTALTNYQSYLQNLGTNRNNNVGTGQERSPMIERAIIPFGLPASQKIIVKLTTDANGQASAIAARLDETLTGAIKYPGFKPARIIKKDLPGGRTVETSAITGLRYLKYAGRSYSIPFGAANNTEREYDAYLAVKTLLTVADTTSRFSYQPESVRLV